MVSSLPIAHEGLVRRAGLSTPCSTGESFSKHSGLLLVGFREGEIGEGVELQRLGLGVSGGGLGVNLDLAHVDLY